MEPSTEWLGKLSELRAAGRPCAVVVVTAAAGSVPRETGARMIVAGGELAWGTIGGGNLEKLAIEHCAELLSRGGSRSGSVKYPLGERTGQCCGGAVTLFFETFAWTRRRVVVFGAGHVAQALGGLAHWLAADVLLIDSRDERAIQPPIPAERSYELLCVDAPEEEVERLPAEALVVVMTHSHALDQAVIERALGREPFRYLGLIGSRRKWQRFQQRLLRKGFTPEQLARVRCPIGVSKVSKEPTAIAISAAAELLEVATAAERRESVGESTG